jgi:hypothetical protein
VVNEFVGLCAVYHSKPTISLFELLILEQYYILAFQDLFKSRKKKNDKAILLSLSSNQLSSINEVLFLFIVLPR